MLTETGSAYSTAPERSQAVAEAGLALGRSGHRLVPLDWAALESVALRSARAFADIVAVNLAAFFGQFGLDPEATEPMTQAVIERGKAMSGLAAWQLTTDAALVSRDTWQLFDGIDCLLAPMLASAPKRLGSFPTDHRDTDLHFDRMTAFAPLAPLANISGFAALTLPFGQDDKGLPLPVQMMAPMGHENLLLGLAATLEAEGRWQHRFDIAGAEALD